MKHLLKFIFILILLTSLSCSNPVGTQISADVESILFIRSNRDFKELAAMRPDGTLIKVILRLDGNFDRIDAARWSPDKSRIVLAGGQLDSQGFIDVIPLWIIDNNGTFIRELTFDGRNPVWSRDGEKIYYLKSEKSDVYTINTDGSNEELVYTAADSILFFITDVSVSEEYIFGFESFLFTVDNKLGISETAIVQIDLQSGEKTFLTDYENTDHTPRLSNDGTKITYYHQNLEGDRFFKSITNVYIMNSDGQNPQNITKLTNFNLSSPFLTWSPDESFIGFNKADQTNLHNENGDIYTIEIKTGIITKLTNTTSNIEKIMDWK